MVEDTVSARRVAAALWPGLPRLDADARSSSSVVAASTRARIVSVRRCVKPGATSLRSRA